MYISKANICWITWKSITLYKLTSRKEFYLYFCSVPQSIHRFPIFDLGHHPLNLRDTLRPLLVTQQASVALLPMTEKQGHVVEFVLAKAGREIGPQDGPRPVQMTSRMRWMLWSFDAPPSWRRRTSATAGCRPSV